MNCCDRHIYQANTGVVPQTFCMYVLFIAMLTTKPNVFVVKQYAARTVKIRTRVVHGHKLEKKTVC